MVGNCIIKEEKSEPEISFWQNNGSKCKKMVLCEMK